jgi:hypothetical protein
MSDGFKGAKKRPLGTEGRNDKREESLLSLYTPAPRGIREEAELRF